MSQVGDKRLTQKSLVSAALVLGGFVLGIAAMRAVDGRNPNGPSIQVPDVVFPAAALKPWFRPVSEYDTGGQPLDDESFGTLMTALDDALTAEETLADFGQEGDIHLWNFVRRLVRPEVTEAQTERIAVYMEGLQERHPDHSNMIAHHAASVALLYADAMPTTPAFTGTPGMSQVTHPSTFADSTFTAGELSDAHVDALLRWISTALTMPETANDFSQEAGRYFGELGRILQRAQLTDRQDERVFAALEEIKASNAEFGETMDREVDKLRRFIPGGIPPNIVANDTEGIEFALEDYRGNIVVLIFSGQWCGPCRVEYPYHRFMLELYEDKPVVLLGVNSDAELATIRQAKIDEGLDYRTWWDGHAALPTAGPIATAWNVLTWPMIYILDEDGVIRHVDKRGGDLIATVDRMLAEMAGRDSVAGLP